MKTSKITNVQGNGSWQGDYGLMYSFEYTLENGEVGLANHKTVEAKYKEGDSVNYEVSKDKQGNNKFSFLTVDKPFNNYSNKKPSQGSFALSYAKDLFIADKISYDQLIPTANKFNNWLKENY